MQMHRKLTAHRLLQRSSALTNLPALTMPLAPPLPLIHVTATSTLSHHLGIVPAVVEANGVSVTTHALLDNGSDKSLVAKRLVSRLGVEDSPADFTISGVNIDSLPYRVK